ncbi:hypothetical protein BJ684DRAFT_18245 [Piptocephalis cylindrospora]|uniref:Tubulin-folding cofactor C n=1 Tax=Piptocephalis cylindrospora TaxID=1907219 RepID=A0A4P9Y8S4_9FUNG|nr:hypothetical protein BJ684DRAFT_18245 [Piptocephalis cylindrospora]|eukprot:RKP15435.1 hypothetical protein BJ684DRAFT_18245 [Piptocephalis cylindrospora]
MNGQKSAQRADAYFHRFQQQENDLHQALKVATTLEDIASIRQQVNDLQQRTTEASTYLPPRDIGQHQKALQGLVDAVEERRGRVAPKKRFVFKRSVSNAPRTPIPKVTEVKEVMPIPQKTCPIQQSMYFNDLSEINTLNSQGDVALEAMEGCIIDARTIPLTTLHLRRLHRCLIIALDVQASVMVFDCTQCLLLLSCQQTEEWSRVQDFGWLQRNIPSPHWTILPQEERWSGQGIDQLGPTADVGSILASTLPWKSASFS